MFIMLFFIFLKDYLQESIMIQKFHHCIDCAATMLALLIVKKFHASILLSVIESGNDRHMHLTNMVLKKELQFLHLPKTGTKDFKL
jgi:hypothetical protein